MYLATLELQGKVTRMISNYDLLLDRNYACWEHHSIHLELQPLPATREKSTEPYSAKFVFSDSDSEPEKR